MSDENKHSQNQISTSNETPLMEGYMNKLGEMVKNWKRRYFRVDNQQQLLYFEEKDDQKPKGIIPLKGARLTYYDPKTYQKSNCFGVQPEGNDRIYVIEASSAQERYDWLRYLFVNGAEISAQSLSALIMNSNRLSNAKPVNSVQNAQST